MGNQTKEYGIGAQLCLNSRELPKSISLESITQAITTQNTVVDWCPNDLFDADVLSRNTGRWIADLKHGCTRVARMIKQVEVFNGYDVVHISVERC